MNITYQRANQILHAAKGKRVIVIGDLALDKYRRGKAHSLSAEAPIPVLKANGYEYYPGCAANLAVNLQAMGASVKLMGVVGNDENGNQLLYELAKHPVDVSGVIRVNDRGTTLKERTTDNGIQQQIVRWDEEAVADIDTITSNAMISVVGDKIIQRKVDAVVLCDYAKGVVTTDLLTRIKDECDNSTPPLFLSPKPGRGLEKTAGLLTAMFMNCAEAHEMAGIEQGAKPIEAVAANILGGCGALSLVITLGARGLIHTTKSFSDPVLAPSIGLKPIDVSGAGDCAFAGYIMAYLGGGTPDELANFTNLAGGLAVTKRGTSVVSRQELLDFLPKTPEDKIYTLDDMVAFREACRVQGKRVVVTNGCFDVIHQGHTSHLELARQQGDVLLIGLNGDESVRILKDDPKRPHHPEAKRAHVLASMACVDGVCIFPDLRATKFLAAVKPDIYVKGDDYRRWQDPSEVAALEAVGAKTVFLTSGKGITATETIAKLRSEQRRALFLDRDGTIIKDKDYLSDPNGVELILGVGAALNRARNAGFLLVMVTNQSGIGRGKFTELDMDLCNCRLREYLMPYGVEFAKIYFAPEAPEQPSKYRKPLPGALFAARDELNIDLSRSFMIGDKWSDVQCGMNAGVAKSYLVGTGKAVDDSVQPDGAMPVEDELWQRASDLAAAVDHILNNPA